MQFCDLVQLIRPKKSPNHDACRSGYIGNDSNYSIYEIFHSLCVSDSFAYPEIKSHHCQTSLKSIEVSSNQYRSIVPIGKYYDYRKQ